MLAAVDDFYTHVLLNLKPWMPAAPRLRPTDTPVTEPVAAPLISTAISSQDGPEPASSEPDQLTDHDISRPTNPAESDAWPAATAPSEADNYPIPAAQ